MTAGMTAHGSMPEHGDNAIYKAAAPSTSARVRLRRRAARADGQSPTLNVGTRARRPQHQFGARSRDDRHRYPHDPGSGPRPTSLAAAAASRRRPSKSTRPSTSSAIYSGPARRGCSTCSTDAAADGKRPQARSDLFHRCGGAEGRLSRCPDVRARTGRAAARASDRRILPRRLRRAGGRYICGADPRHGTRNGRLQLRNTLVEGAHDMEAASAQRHRSPRASSRTGNHRAKRCSPIASSASRARASRPRMGVSRRRRRACAARARLDARPAAGLLHGVPIGVKDLFDTIDMPTGYGSPIYAGHRPGGRCRDASRSRVRQAPSSSARRSRPNSRRCIRARRAIRTTRCTRPAARRRVRRRPSPTAWCRWHSARKPRDRSCGPRRIAAWSATSRRSALINRVGVKMISDTLDTVGGFARSVSGRRIVRRRAQRTRRARDRRRDRRSAAHRSAPRPTNGTRANRKQSPCSRTRGARLCAAAQTFATSRCRRLRRSRPRADGDHGARSGAVAVARTARAPRSR